MNLSEPGVLYSAFAIGMIGFGVFLYGKKSEKPGALGIGLLMCVFPCFIHSLALMWGLAGACFCGLYALRRFA